jgi:hypothetical protein
MQIGDYVFFVDPLSRPRAALVTAVWGDQPAYMPVTREPGLNVVLVSNDPARADSYGRQIERETSVVHVTNQPAPGLYWCRPEEYDPIRDHKLRSEV